MRKTINTLTTTLATGFNQDYLPDKLKHASYFIPNENGKYERALGATKEKIDQFKKK